MCRFLPTNARCEGKKYKCHFTRTIYIQKSIFILCKNIVEGSTKYVIFIFFKELLLYALFMNKKHLQHNHNNNFYRKGSTENISGRKFEKLILSLKL